MYDPTLHRGRKHFCQYCLHAFITEEILKCHIKGCLKILGKQIKIQNFVKLKNFERKIKSLFMIYVDFESIPIPEGNGKQNPSESCTNKYQKHVVFSYDYKLVCVDDKFSKPFKSYLGQDAVYKFIRSMVEVLWWCDEKRL